MPGDGQHQTPLTSETRRRNGLVCRVRLWITLCTLPLQRSTAREQRPCQKHYHVRMTLLPFLHQNTHYPATLCQQCLYNIPMTAKPIPPRAAAATGKPVAAAMLPDSEADSDADAAASEAEAEAEPAADVASAEADETAPLTDEAAAEMLSRMLVARAVPLLRRLESEDASAPGELIWLAMNDPNGLGKGGAHRWQSLRCWRWSWRVPTPRTERSPRPVQ